MSANEHADAVPLDPPSRNAYNQIGRTYGVTRTTDPRIAAAIVEALGGARTVLNVGAGTGSYEPGDRRVVAVDPSPVMLAQRPPGAAPAVQAVAEALPFADRSFDACLAVLSTHHWSDPPRGLEELRRVARQRIVIFTHDVSYVADFWVCHYFPYIAELDAVRLMPVEEIAKRLGGAAIEAVPLPADCMDGVLAAFWRRPTAYLDESVRAGISTFVVMPPRALESGLQRLRADLASGRWAERYGDLLERSELDCGYRLVVTELDHG